MKTKSQKSIFQESEGDAWYFRNIEHLAVDNLESFKNDFIVKALTELGIVPRRILEIGCGAGPRLEYLRTTYGCHCTGIDPSLEAITFARKAFPLVRVLKGVASSLPFAPEEFDCLIAGFCLCVCDREDLFKIAYEMDRVLNTEGFLIIGDFCTKHTYHNAYKHHLAIRTYKMDYSRMFSWNPAYNTIYHVTFTHGALTPVHCTSPDEHYGVTVLHKSLEYAWPGNPYCKDRDRNSGQYTV